MGPMRHFDFLDDADRARLFFRAPEPFDACAEPRFLATALGATLYSPATRPKLADDIARRAGQGVTSMVVCLEDSIPDDALLEGERNAIAQLRALRRHARRRAAGVRPGAHARADPDDRRRARRTTSAC